MKNKLEKYFKGEYEQYKEESKYEIMSYDEWFECIKGLDYYKKERLLFLDHKDIVHSIHL